MHRDDFRQIVSETVRQSLTEKGISINALSEEQLNSLVTAIADGVFAGLETALDEATDVQAAAAAASAAAVAAASARQTPPVSRAPGDVTILPEAGVVPTQSPATIPTVGASGSYAAAQAAAAVPPADEDAEILLWRGRPYLTIGTIYELTSQRLRVIHGIVSNVIEEVELVRVRDTAVKQNVGERMFDIGDIVVFSSDTSTPQKVLYNVRNPIEVREMIRKAVYEERERRRLLYREEMHDAEYGIDQTP